MFLDHLSCTETRERLPWRVLQTVSATGMPLECVYDIAAASRAVTPEQIAQRPADMWRYRELLPLPNDADPVTLGEGFTPLLDLPRLAQEHGIARLSVKDESQNPTGSFKARGMSAAVSMARALGARALAVPSAGNAGGALAAYGARAGLPVHIAMPEDVPLANLIEARVAGAEVELCNGNISDCGKWIREQAREHGWFDLSTLKEPYRVEGKKTMGYELAEQLGWSLPDAILYPAGGGTGLVGMWKAFGELRELGWIDSAAKLPKMIAVQAAGCAPIVSAFETGSDHAVAPEHPETCASGLRVPGPIGDRWMLRVIAASGGCAVAATDAELLEGTRRVARTEGTFFAPEAGALVAVLPALLEAGRITTRDHVVLFNTGTGLKYLDCFDQR